MLIGCLMSNSSSIASLDNWSSRIDSLLSFKPRFPYSR
uniref:Uncharacterized protein n=1 Tax=Rhizophora mucronata TaxID=61149 RepID=A0A2P2NTC8_RHIMU